MGLLVARGGFVEVILQLLSIIRHYYISSPCIQNIFFKIERSLFFYLFHPDDNMLKLNDFKY